MKKMEKPKNPIKTFKKLFGYIGKYKWQLLVVVFATIGSVGANLGGTYMLQRALAIIEGYNPAVATVEETLANLGSQIAIIIAIY